MLATIYQNRLADIGLDATPTVAIPGMAVLRVSCSLPRLIKSLTRKMGEPNGYIASPRNKECIHASWRLKNSSGEGLIMGSPIQSKVSEFVACKVSVTQKRTADRSLVSRVQNNQPFRVCSVAGTVFSFESGLRTKDWQYVSTPLLVNNVVRCVLKVPIKKNSVSTVLVISGSENPRHQVHANFPGVDNALAFLMSSL